MPVEDPKQMIFLAQTLLASISDVTGLVVSIELEHEAFMEIGCYIGRSFPAIMEIKTSENIPSNAADIFRSLSKNVDHAKYLVKKCCTEASPIPPPEIRSTIAQLGDVIRSMGESLSLIPSSTFVNHEYAKVAVQSISKEMRNCHFEISQLQVSEPNEEKLRFPLLKGLPEVESETDLYSVDISEISTEISQSFYKPQMTDFFRGKNSSDKENHRSSSTRSSNSFPHMAEYMEPLYETFFCPLTKQIMDDPVTIASGITYERKAIAECIRNYEENAEDVICPATGQKLMTTVLKTNIALQTTIEEWKERNEAARIKIARVALSLASSDTMILQALHDLQILCQNREYNKVKVRHIGMLPLITQFLEHKSKKARCATLGTLKLLVEDDEAKDIIGTTNAITTTMKMLTGNHLPLRHAALSFLLELSNSKKLSEMIGSATGGILMLITMKYNQTFDALTAEMATKILMNLETSPTNIKHMAENGLLEPLLNHLIEGPEKTQTEMGDYLGGLVLGNDTKIYVAERASPTLINMAHSSNTLTRKAAFKALLQISTYQPNSTILINAGTVPIMIEEIFNQRIYNEPMNFKEDPAAVLANILDSGVSPESIQVNNHGHTLISDYIVYNLTQMLKSSTSDELNISLIRILLCLTNSRKSTTTVVAVVKETEASYNLIELINSPLEDLGTATIKLLIALAPHIGHTLADRLCKTIGQPENLIKNSIKTSRITEKHAVAAKFLAKLPHQNLTLNLALIHQDTVPTVIRMINEIQKSGTRTSRFANSYLEGLVGILVRFTTTLYEPQILQVARKHNFTIVFTELLTRTASDEIQKLSAIGLENLSTESINLSKPLQMKKPKLMKFLSLRKSLSIIGSSKQKMIQVCPIHRGACSSDTTFCLLEAKAIERLLACLNNENSNVVEAALSAICTLLDDKVDVDKSINVLNEVNAVYHVLNVLREHKQEGLWQKSFWMIERFLMKGGDKSISDINQDRSLPSTLVSAFHHGNGSTRQMAEKILRYLNKMPNLSTQYF